MWRRSPVRVRERRQTAPHRLLVPQRGPMGSHIGDLFILHCFFYIMVGHLESPALCSPSRSSHLPQALRKFIPQLPVLGIRVHSPLSSLVLSRPPPALETHVPSIPTRCIISRCSRICGIAYLVRLSHIGRSPVTVQMNGNRERPLSSRLLFSVVGSFAVAVGRCGLTIRWWIWSFLSRTVFWKRGAGRLR
jgi:hypothetical protein